MFSLLGNLLILIWRILQYESKRLLSNNFVECIACILLTLCTHITMMYLFKKSNHTISQSKINLLCQVPWETLVE